jgi:alpha-L-fucosidase
MSYPDSATAKHHTATYGDAPYADFKPVFEQHLNEGWDPDEWADLFYKAGAKYVVLVTKHHDGYTLWPSAVANPNRENWGSQRDLVGELAKAVRARGMRFGSNPRHHAQCALQPGLCRLCVCTHRGAD